MLRRASMGRSVDTAAIATAVAAAVPNAAAIAALVQPSHGPGATGELTGQTTYSILGALSGKYVTLYGFTVTSDVACTVSWWSANVFAMTDTHPLQASGNWVVSPGTALTLRTNLQDALVLKCSSVTAKLRVTYWAAYTDT